MSKFPAAVMVLDQYELEWLEVGAHELSVKMERIDHLIALFGMDDDEVQREVPRLLHETLGYLKEVAESPLTFGYDIDKVTLN